MVNNAEKDGTITSTHLLIGMQKYKNIKKNSMDFNGRFRSYEVSFTKWKKMGINIQEVKCSAKWKQCQKQI